MLCRTVTCIDSHSGSQKIVLVHERIDTRQSVRFDQIVVTRVVRVKQAVGRESLFVLEQGSDGGTDRWQYAAHLIGQNIDIDILQILWMTCEERLLIGLTRKMHRRREISARLTEMVGSIRELESDG